MATRRAPPSKRFPDPGGGLAVYRAKRRFERTPEPAGGEQEAEGDAVRRFVVQRHAARREHYDFRLEIGGVLKSWAIPKGPSLDPGERRLAVETEDHPLEYADFEGVIPAGEYGGGTVLLWDRGTWVPERDPIESYRRGRISFRLEGEKLRGQYSLVRLAKSPEKNAWLLIKKRDAHAVPGSGSRILEDRPKSVLSGLDLQAIARDKPRIWRSSRGGDGGSSSSAANLRVLGVVITHPKRVMFAEAGITKQALAKWYARVGEAMLPHVAGRPLMLVRCPEGRGAGCFFQKHVGRGIGPHVRTAPIEEGGVEKPSIVVDSVQGLLALAQLGVLEIHTWGARVQRLDSPDLLVFDLDPAADVPFDRVVRGARALRELLAPLGLESFVKVTGGKGLHVVVPIAPTLSSGQVKDFSRLIANVMVEAEPERYVANMRKSRRTGKVFIDFFRNGRGATFIAPFSTRARPHAPVALPVSWDELDALGGAGTFTLASISDGRLERSTEAWRRLPSLRPSVDLRLLERLNIRLSHLLNGKISAPAQP